MPYDPASDDEEPSFGHPLPPEDRLWRHPSEIGGLVSAARKRREVSTLRILALTLAGGIVGSVITVGALGVGGAFSGDDNAERASSASTPVTQPAATTALGGEGTKWTDIVRTLEPSIARVEGTEANGKPDGSAVALRVAGEDTYFVTSADLVRDLPDVSLALADGRRRKATVVGADAYTNLAVLLVKGEQVAVPELGPTTEIQSGADALVVAAAPASAESLSVAKALVSSTNHQERSETRTMVPGLLQTDANVTSEAKGGALVDANGALVGVMVLMKRDETGIERFGYALPTAMVTETADSFIATGLPTQVWLGVQGEDLPSGGALINAVVPSSPAQQCNLQPGDVVVMVNNTPVGTMSALVMGLRQLEPNDTVVLTYVRQGLQDLCPTLLTRPPEPGSLTGSGEVSSGAGAATTTPAPDGTTNVPAATETSEPPTTSSP